MLLLHNTQREHWTVAARPGTDAEAFGLFLSLQWFIRWRQKEGQGNLLRQKERKGNLLRSHQGDSLALASPALLAHCLLDTPAKQT